MNALANHLRMQGATPRRRGFTLIETALAMIIVGVGIVASIRLFAACSMENRISTHMTSAMLLAGNVREAMAGLSFSDPIAGDTSVGNAESGETLATFNDVDDFNGTSPQASQSFNPPIDSLRNSITSMSQYTQVVSVVPIWPNKLSSNTNDTTPEISRTTYTGAVRVKVRILFRVNPADTPEEVYRCSWVRVDN